MERVESWLGRPCGCEERQRKLDALDAWVRQAARVQMKDSVEWLKRLMS